MSVQLNSQLVKQKVLDYARSTTFDTNSVALPGQLQ